jgi:hypothetical protein
MFMLTEKTLLRRRLGSNLSRSSRTLRCKAARRTTEKLVQRNKETNTCCGEVITHQRNTLPSCYARCLVFSHSSSNSAKRDKNSIPSVISRSVPGTKLWTFTEAADSICMPQSSPMIVNFLATSFPLRSSFGSGSVYPRSCAFLNAV